VSPSRQSDGRRFSGKMLWFNDAKDSGLIATTTGERLYVAGTSFRDERPQGRCAGVPVSFYVTDRDETRNAEDVVFVNEAAPRRARRRSGYR